MKSFLIFLFVLFTAVMPAQSISGTVFDSKSKQPLEGASVYFEGTTRGGITDADGHFVLNIGKQISSPLIVSYLGYTDAVLSASWSESMNIGLVIAPESLDEVVIAGKKRFSRKELMVAFKEQFLGNSSASKYCKIINETAIELWYDLSEKSLRASCNQPVVVYNGFLGYELRFRIVDFSIVYHDVSINPLDRKQTTYSGTSFFIDKQKGVRKFEKRRQKVYKTSTLRLMRTIALEDWENEDFTYYYRGYRTDPAKIFSITDSLNGKKVRFSNRLLILDDNKKQSELIPVSSYFMIDGYGNFYPASALLFSGQMGNQRIDKLLPLDYNLTFAD